MDGGAGRSPAWTTGATETAQATETAPTTGTTWAGGLPDEPALWLAEEDVALLAPGESHPRAAGSSVVLREVVEQTSYGEIVLNDLVRRQRRLSLSVAGVFLALLFSVPAVNLALPGVAALSVLGLPLAWLILGLLVYPALWLLAVYFTTTAGALEDEFTHLLR